MIALRSVLDGHVKISHLIYAQQDWYPSLFEDVYVGDHRWLSAEVQSESPVNLGLLTVGKSLHCILTAHGLCATIVKDDMGWMFGLILNGRH